MHLPDFFKHTTYLFLTLRTADLVNVAAGMWIVPRFVQADDLGAVLPFVTFATCLSTPAFAFAFLLMRESNRLACERAFGKLKALLRGSFLVTALLIVLALGLGAVALPHFVREMRTGSLSLAFIALAGSFLGSCAPIYQDALNGLARFGAYGLTEIAAALARVATMLAVMPFQGLLGFFSGNVAQPLARIACSLFALRKELRVPSETYWTPPLVRSLALAYGGVLLYLLASMLVSLLELSLIRTLLPSCESGAYYLETRLTDILGYLTLPILLVLFPTAAERAREGRSTRPLVLRCALASALGMGVLALVYGFWGRELLSLFPNAASFQFDDGTNRMLLALLLLNFAGAFQTFYTNAEIAAGRFAFLKWFVPLHLAYAAYLAFATHVASATSLIGLFLVFALLRLGCVLAAIVFTH